MNSFTKQIADLARPNERVFALLNELWTSFGRICFSKGDSDKPSSYKLGVQEQANGRIRASMPNIVVQWGGGRELEGLAHELLHLKVADLGYPMVVQNQFCDASEARRVNGIINIASHEIMLPMFVELRLERERFLCAEEPGKEVEEWLNFFSTCERYDTPESYGARVSGFLETCGITDLKWAARENGSWTVI